MDRLQLRFLSSSQNSQFVLYQVLKHSASFFFLLINKEASTVLCSVVKHAGCGRARKKCRGKHEM